jgi:hypothetical protein
MAIQCSWCGRQYDVTLFQFGRTVVCDCGEVVRADEPQRSLTLKARINKELEELESPPEPHDD